MFNILNLHHRTFYAISGHHSFTPSHRVAKALFLHIISGTREKHAPRLYEGIDLLSCSDDLLVPIAAFGVFIAVHIPNCSPYSLFTLLLLIDILRLSPIAKYMRLLISVI